MNGAQACGIQSVTCAFDGGSPWQIFRARLRERRRTGAKAAVRVIRTEAAGCVRGTGRSAPRSVDGAEEPCRGERREEDRAEELVRAENAKQPATWDEAGVGIGPGNPASSHARQPGQRPHRLRALQQNHRPPRRPARPPRCLSARILPCPVCSSTPSPLRPRPSVYVTASPSRSHCALCVPSAVRAHLEHQPRSLGSWCGRYCALRASQSNPPVNLLSHRTSWPCFSFCLSRTWSSGNS